LKENKGDEYVFDMRPAIEDHGKTDIFAIYREFGPISLGSVVPTGSDSLDGRASDLEAKA
jgi:hypothetical protein